MRLLIFLLQVIVFVILVLTWPVWVLLLWRFVRVANRQEPLHSF